jgi:hypothetical protein
LTKWVEVTGQPLEVLLTETLTVGRHALRFANAGNKWQAMVQIAGYAIEDYQKDHPAEAAGEYKKLQEQARKNGTLAKPDFGEVPV